MSSTKVLEPQVYQECPFHSHHGTSKMLNPDPSIACQAKLETRGPRQVLLFNPDPLLRSPHPTVLCTYPPIPAAGLVHGPLEIHEPREEGAGVTDSCTLAVLPPFECSHRVQMAAKGRVVSKHSPGTMPCVAPPALQPARRPPWQPCPVQKSPCRPDNPLPKLQPGFLRPFA